MSNALLAEMKVLLETQRERVVILGILGAVLLVFGVRAALKIAPSSAQAASAPSAEDLTTQWLADRLSEGVSAHLPRVVIPHIEGSGRDLFAYDRRYFPAPPLPEAQVAAKSGSGAVESTEAAEPDPGAERRIVEAEASRLTLTSVMVGAQPIAVIEVSGGERARHVVSVGDEVIGFRVTAIDTARVVVEMNGHAVELAREQ